VELEGDRKVRSTCLCLGLRERMWRACLLKCSIYVVDDVRKKQTDTSNLGRPTGCAHVPVSYANINVM